MPTSNEPYEPNELDRELLKPDAPWRAMFRADTRYLESALKEAGRVIHRNPTFAAKYANASETYLQRREVERREAEERRAPKQINGYHDRAFEESLVEIAVIDPSDKKTRTTMTPRIQWNDGWILHYRERPDDDTSPIKTRGIAATKEGAVLALRQAEAFLLDQYTTPVGVG